MLPAVLLTTHGWSVSDCAFVHSGSLNQPVVQQCVSCLVRGLVPSGIHTISFSKLKWVWTSAAYRLREKLLWINTVFKNSELK